MHWLGFGFNAFGQIRAQEELAKEENSDADKQVKVSKPTELSSDVDSTCKCTCSYKTCQIRASWSRRASLHFDGGSCVCLFGYSTESCGAVMSERCGCTDVFISEGHLTLAFPDRIECWDLQRKDKTASWSMELSSELDNSAVNLPLVPGGYLALKTPFFRTLSPHLQAKSLALGGEHAILLSASGTVYTWGQGSHGQLGHGELISEEEPKTVEALWGMHMSSVAAGGWHTVCISDTGDLYVWGWNESGQLGLPSQGLRKVAQQKSDQKGELCHKASTSFSMALEGEKDEEVFISIQAFPALLDVNPLCEIRSVSCGSRHTAAVTTTGDLYTWGWGEYGQLGHQTLVSSDEPQRVEFFRENHLQVFDVVCGPWNTFTAVLKEDLALTNTIKSSK